MVRLSARRTIQYSTECVKTKSSKLIDCVKIETKVNINISISIGIYDNDLRQSSAELRCAEVAKREQLNRQELLLCAFESHV